MEKSDRSSALDCLAERMGIEGKYRNAHGHVVHTNAETKRRLLSAMGLAAADERSRLGPHSIYSTVPNGCDRWLLCRYCRPIVARPWSISSFLTIPNSSSGAWCWRTVRSDRDRWASTVCICWASANWTAAHCSGDG